MNQTLNLDLDLLNAAQREAVTMSDGHALVLAGAGSGKTRVLTHRIAYLLQYHHVSPFEILAVTFTNKAAGEMRTRIEAMIGGRVGGMWIGTFHGIAHRLLRKHYKSVNLPENFQIIDSDDQYRLVRRILKSLNLAESHWPPKQAQWFINKQKDSGLRASMLSTQDRYSETMQRIYLAYEETCLRGGLVDFAELLLCVHELWKQNPEILQHYQQRFKYVLVDEFQDTNTVQFEWLKNLIGDHNYIMAVGDDDQSIYGWRGAKIENIQYFQKQFPNCKIIRLEQNYRSTGNILRAANALIDNNFGRLGKNLWTSHGDGEKLSVYAGFNETDEARFIVDRISEFVDAGHSYNDIAILYRSNAQSRILEEIFLQRGIAYQVYGGLRFFERAEIKDVLAYLRLIVARNDDAAFERVVNMPARGIGEKTLTSIRLYARSEQQSLWQSAKILTENKKFSARALNAVEGFLSLINDLDEQTEELNLAELIENVIDTSGLTSHFSLDKTEKGLTRVENLAEIVSAASQFEHYITEEEEELDLSPLMVFLTHAALEAGERQSNKKQERVQLMTLHSAKGLEFPFVIIAGLEEGLFPHSMSFEDPGRLEEERRLCYVGITRAEQKVLLTYAESRRLRGQETYNRPSRFLREIPNNLLQEVRLKSEISRPLSSVKPNSRIIDNSAPFRLGQRVRHAKFGEGVVLQLEGNGNHAQVQVKFSDNGTKKLALAYAKLEVID